MRRRVRLSLIATVTTLAVLTAGACQPEELDQWLIEHHKPLMAEPQRSQFAAYLTLVKAELDRRNRFVGNISPVSAERLGLSWRPGCPVGPESLRLLTLSFWGMDNQEHTGELIVHQSIAAQTVGAFKALWDEKFPINRMDTADKFLRPEDFAPGGELKPTPPAIDRVNDTSAFMCRRTTGATSWSEHSKGLAIDINPVQNPYIKGSTLIPLNGQVPRDPNVPGTMYAGSDQVRAFTSRGLKWGGVWNSIHDYMHFSPTNR
jgi:hypothetical protein